MICCKATLVILLSCRIWCAWESELFEHPVWKQHTVCIPEWRPLLCSEWLPIRPDASSSKASTLDAKTSLWLPTLSDSWGHVGLDSVNTRMGGPWEDQFVPGSGGDEGTLSSLDQALVQLTPQSFKLKVKQRWWKVTRSLHSSDCITKLGMFYSRGAQLDVMLL